jgi:uncharacterized protein (TIGR02594 family)
MQFNLERLTSLLLVASTIALVGTSSPAHARRHLPARMAPAELASPWMMEGTQRWADVSYASPSQVETARATRGHRGIARSPSNEWTNEAARDRSAAWDYQGGSATVPTTRRKTRVASLGKNAFGSTRGGGSDLVSEARRWIGTNPTGWASVWCGRFMNFVLERTGHRGSGSNLARSFASYGSRISGPQVGAIAVMGRSGRAAGGSAGGHVGVVSGIDSNGNPIIISGNHGHRVAEAVYPRNRIFAYVMP